ncbi:MAG: hypothetical protein F6J92_20180 [Symploca sp. SIO1A3]|nr:hypothetical protein [Symploca sp. SIO1A3]
MPDNLDAILRRIQEGRHSEADIERIAIALGERSVAIAGDANNALIITGDNNTTHYHLPPEVISLLRERARPHQLRLYLLLLIVWVFISGLISLLLSSSSYLQGIILFMAELIKGIGNYFNNSLAVYYQIIILIFACTLMLPITPLKISSKWFLLPILLIFALYLYQSLLVSCLLILHNIASNNIIQLFGIILSSYVILGLYYIQSHRLTVRQDLLLCILCPLLMVFQAHVWILRQIINVLLRS